MFSDDLSSYLETSKVFTKILLIKVVGYKINKATQEMKKIPPVVASSQTKFFRGNFNEEAKDLDADDWKTGIKDAEDTDKWKIV